MRKAKRVFQLGNRDLEKAVIPYFRLFCSGSY